MDSAARSNESSDTPLKSFSADTRQPPSERVDQGATIAATLGGLALAALLAAILGAWLLRDLVPVAVGVSLFLVAPIVGFYAMLFAIGALANRTPHPVRAWTGAISGALPLALVLGVLAHGADI